VGVGQLVQRDPDPGSAPTPADMLAETARRAARDAGLSPRALADLDTVGLVDVMAWRPRNGPRLVAEALGARPSRCIATAVGGEIPLRLLAHAGRAIGRGESRMALVAGCNALRTLRLARRAGVELGWETGGEGRPELLGQNRAGSTAREQAVGLRMPIHVYPIFENALRARRGLDLATHRKSLGVLMSRFTRVAAENPYAWFPVARSPEELVTPGPANRMIAYPYTKYLNAVMETDQAAAALLLSAGEARARGIPESRWILLRGAAHDAERAWFPSERPDLAACHAIRRAVGAALGEAGLGLADVHHLDFYSCFPVAVEMTCEMLGIPESDPRGFTVTGGLPYAGGPGNNATLHSVASMVERLREAPGRVGLVTGNGWYLTKHSALLLSSAPAEGAAAEGAPAPEADGEGPAPELAEAPAGRGRLETWTVLYDREGRPERGIAVGRLDDGRRFLANTPDDPAFLEAFAGAEQVGREGRVGPRDEGPPLFDPV